MLAAGPLLPSSRLQAILTTKAISPIACWEHLDSPEVKTKIQKFVKSIGGIYIIINLVTGSMYVGSSIVNRMANRLHRHLFAGSGSTLVWAAVLKYGLSNFAFVVVESVASVDNDEDNKELLAREDYYIKTLQPIYNIAPQAGNTFGVRHTEETKIGMRLNYSDERRAKIGSLNRGKILSASTIEAIRAAAFNRPSMSDDTRDKISANSAKAQVYSVSRVDNSLFLSTDNTKVSSLNLRTLPVVAQFIGCDEKTVRRALAKEGIVKKI